MPFQRPQTLEQRFWAKVQKLPGDDACWLFTGATSSKGYGSIGYEGKIVGAHQVAWFLATGKWPTQQVLHKCDNPPCCRFAHLFEGTQLDNIADMKAKGRARSIRGEASPRAKLTDAQILEIRELYASGKFSQRELGGQFGIDQTHVSLIVRLKTRVNNLSSARN